MSLQVVVMTVAILVVVVREGVIAIKTHLATVATGLEL
jgi:hypothetical protein